MSPVLPFDIIALIIDIVGENEDTNLLKELALVSQSFHQICSKHLFATVELYDVDRDYHVASSKKGFVKLLRSRPDVVNYIRKFTYNFQSLRLSPTHPSFNNEYHLVSSILSNLLRTLSRLNCLTITASQLDWNELDSSLTSAFLYLMNLPTIEHIDLSYIQNFPLSSFTPSVNLHRFDISYLRCFDRPEEDDSPEIVVESEMMPQIREFHTSGSPLLTTRLLHAKKQDGRPAFSLMDLRRLSTCLEDERNIRYVLQNAKLLEKLHLSVASGRGQSLVKLHDILSSSSRTLKVLDLTVSIYDSVPLPLSGLCEGLEAMAGNMLEALSFEVHVDDHETEESIGSEVQRVEKVLIKPGWSSLRQVSFKVKIACWGNSAKLYEELQSLPDNYLSQLSRLESVTFNFSIDVFKCILY